MNAKIKLIQLPIPPPAFYAGTGNVPLASAILKSVTSLELKSLSDQLEVSFLEPETSDLFGDRMLLDSILSESPDILGFSLYLWNSERSLFLAREIKKRNPKTIIVIGGPEVHPENTLLHNSETYDFALVGEGEEIFPLLVSAILKNDDLSEFPNLFRPNGISPPELSKKIYFPEFSLNKYPSPYVLGDLKIEGDRSIYLETVRGCRSECSYCFYPRSSSVLRSLSLEESTSILRRVMETGGRDIVFLDPTFNHRPGFENFLDKLIELNSDQKLKFFAELRSEGLNQKTILKLKQAGFYRIELGMQSINKETLKRVRRYGDPEKIADVALRMSEVGIDLLLDIIIGLPGDKPEDVVRGIEFFRDKGLEEYVQAFYLSVLPGTELRKTAHLETIEYLKTPPYRILKSNYFTENDLIDVFRESEELLDRRMDEYPRPHLIDERVDSNDIYRLDLNDLTDWNILKRPSALHYRIWIEGTPRDSILSTIQKIIKIRTDIDPFCILDLVLCTSDLLPIDLLEDLKNQLDNLPLSYLSRTLLHRNENMQRRLVLLFEKGIRIPKSYLDELDTGIQVFQNMELDFVLKHLDGLGDRYPSARILNEEISSREWKRLSDIDDPELISFKSPDLEKKWTQTVLYSSE
ncbi:MAG: B12-binding domain-containing radical SAM protein [Leptospiraceae bacterium]|nr:B12-binding domain-containing radical SAM protein [Leptospiraceae bacterium]MCP5510635.1 B12-binding domain-containing radical SAM protein [Leptospiraceae bacterium]